MALELRHAVCKLPVAGRVATVERISLKGLHPRPEHFIRQSVPTGSLGEIWPDFFKRFLRATAHALRLLDRLVDVIHPGVVHADRVADLHRLLLVDRHAVRDLEDALPDRLLVLTLFLDVAAFPGRLVTA